MEIAQQIKTIIVEHLGVPQERVTETASFSKDLNADSLDALDLLMAINEAFNINISPEKMMSLETVQDLVQAVLTEKNQ